MRLEIPRLNAVAADLPAAAVRALRNNPHVEFVEEDVKRYALAAATPSRPPYVAGQLVPYGIHMVQADQLPDTYAANRKLCIIDSGYDLNHEDLSGNTVTGSYDPGTGWWYSDENHHGTHVAGTIAAIDNSGTGVVGVNLNRRLQLHIVKVFGADGWAYSSTLAAAVDECAAAGSNVVSMSLGGALPSRIEIMAFNALAAQGIMALAAAGNDGTTSIQYPAGYPGVISVGALDENKAWAPFSQRNSKVELSAPGVDVLSTVPMGAGVHATLKVGGADFKPGVIYNNVPGAFSGTLGGAATTTPSVSVSDTDGAALNARLGQEATVSVEPYNYGYYDGTSMATPHVSGTAALVWSYFPSCSAEQLRRSLGRSAQDLGKKGRDDQFGYGLVQAKAAYDRIRTLGCGN
ncbi:S8 family serine peptidase [Massilia cavernae]|uniref:Peptidase S8 n=1 Tax=Massilia cavernae TaxID=2320864 RepID=A0A418XSB0_9BURK|nr:S8 family serine peptidase [Massilia cavernae]RJG15382.1 peptidase S8 [Massilia cavernae]